MNIYPSETLTEEQVQKGKQRMVREGISSEAMTTLTGGAFLVALALKLGATNFQIGLLAALPTFSNIFQLLAIYFLQKFKNRRAISVISSFLARIPILIIAFLPFLFSAGTSLVMLITLLFVHFFFGTITNLSWNSWMKDLIPEKSLGSYFSHRSRILQIVNVTLSLALAFILDYSKNFYPQHELLIYCLMFGTGSIIGLIGTYLLAKTPEPKMEPEEEIKIFKFFKKPLSNKNYKNFLVFNSLWAFATNLAIPFFSVYLMTVLNLKLSFIIGLNILSQLSSILFIKLWGRYSDKFSNKTILSFCAPLYITSLMLWPFTTMPGIHLLTFPLLGLIFILMGISSSGINLALGNIGFKLTPKNETISYISTRSMVISFFTAIAPIIGGLMADFFSNQSLSWNIEWKGPSGKFLIPFINLENWDFFFIFGAVLAIFSLKKLTLVTEAGEKDKKTMFSVMKRRFRTSGRTKAMAISGIMTRTFAKKALITPVLIEE